jgi:hypothetical protein
VLSAAGNLHSAAAGALGRWGAVALWQYHCASVPRTTVPTRAPAAGSFPGTGRDGAVDGRARASSGFGLFRWVGLVRGLGVTGYGGGQGHRAPPRIARSPSTRCTRRMRADSFAGPGTF